MNISGVLVHARPGSSADVSRAIAALAGTEVHSVTPDDRLIVTIEEPDGTVGKTILEIEKLDGVLSAALVYQHSEPESQLEEVHHAVHTS